MASADILRAAHAELPWEAGANAVFAGDACIAICDGPQLSHARDTANAAFIVRACNAHYQMLEALKALDVWYRDSFPGGLSYILAKLPEDTLDTWKQAQSAIAAAEAEAGR